MARTATKNVVALRPTRREPIDRAAIYANLLLRGIKDELNNARFFTREDLLHVRVFSHISTITRYQYVRECVLALIESGEIVALTKTNLCLPGMQGEYDAENTLSELYIDHILNLCGPYSRNTLTSALHKMSIYRTMPSVDASLHRTNFFEN